MDLVGLVVVSAWPVDCAVVAVLSEAGKLEEEGVGKSVVAALGVEVELVDAAGPPGRFPEALAPDAKAAEGSVLPLCVLAEEGFAVELLPSSD